MKNANTRSALLAVALWTVVLYSSPSMAHGSYDPHHGDPKPVCKTVKVSESEAGPAPYHAVYSAITATNVTLQNFTIRTEDGLVVEVPTPPMTVNLQDLKGFSKGFKLDLTTVNFPGGAPNLQAAEIQLDVVSGSTGAAVSGDESCSLVSIPKKLNFYTPAAIALVHDKYHVKVDFSALNGIEINLITTVTQNRCCTENKHCGDHDKDDKEYKSFEGFLSALNQSHESGGGGSCALVGEPASTTVKKCKLVNRRYPITTIPLAIDDDF